MRKLQVVGGIICFCAIALFASSSFLPVKIDTFKVSFIFIFGVLTSCSPYLYSLIKNYSMSGGRIKTPDVNICLDLSTQKLRDYECLNYLTKRLAELDSVKGKELCREINDIFFSKEYLNEKVVTRE